MAAKKSSSRKVGRNKRRTSAERQRSRTEANKVRNHNRQRKLAGLPPVGPAAARRQMDLSIIKD